MNSRRTRPFHCAIASKEVTIALRAGGGFREPAIPYVRCDERDCQYVDENQPPCPLDPAMFDDGSAHRLARHLQEHAGSRFCYACLTAVLGMTHEQLRRASWHIKNESGMSIGPGRCCVCRRRGVSLVVRDGILRAPRRQPDESSAITQADALTARVIAFIAASRGEALCAACIALSTELTLADSQRILGQLGEIPEFLLEEAVCSLCGRQKQAVRMRSAEPLDPAHAPAAGAMGRAERYRGWDIEVLSFKTGAGWRPLALVSREGRTRRPDMPALVFGLSPTKHEADEVAINEVRAWIDKQFLE